MVVVVGHRPVLVGSALSTAGLAGVTAAAVGDDPCPPAIPEEFGKIFARGHPRLAKIGNKSLDVGPDLAHGLLEEVA